MCRQRLLITSHSSLVGVPAISLLTLRQDRISGLFGALVAFGLQRKRSSFVRGLFFYVHVASTVGLIIPNKKSWYRNLLNFLAFHIFMLYAKRVVGLEV